MIAGAVPAVLMVFILFVIPGRLDSIRQGKYDPSGRWYDHSGWGYEPSSRWFW